MTEATRRDEPTRRGILNYLLGAGLLAWLGSALYPMVRFLTPLPKSGPTGPTRLTRAELGKLESKGFVIVPMGNRRVIVFEDQQAKLRALDAKCTHEGCTVQYVPGESLIWCACHNGKFDLDGRVLAGPPPRPLPSFRAKRDDEGNVVVATEKA